MPDEKLAALISGLADPDSAVRENSAGEIFRRGCELVAPLVCEWLADADLARQIVTEEGHPLLTDGAAAKQIFEKENRPRLTVGLAVEPARFDGIRAANGPANLAEVPPDQDAREFELEFAGGVRLDILTTRDLHCGGAISRYLQKVGEGIQQVEIDVRNADRATEILRASFHLQPIYPATRAGANGTRVNFFLAAVPSGGKVLVELVEAKPGRT